MAQTNSPDSQESIARRRHLARNTLLVAASFGLATLMGLFRNIVIARQFGIGADLDAYFAAFKLPDLLFTIVAGGALATAFIPVFANYLADGDRAGAWRLASAITNLVVIATSFFAVVVWLSAPFLVSWLIAPGFSPEQQAETAQLMRLLLISTIVFGISSVQSSVLHGFKHFLLPALAPAVYPLGIALGALWLAPSLGIRGLAVGAIIGSILHLALKIPGLLYYGFQWRPVLDLGTPQVRRVLVLMGPRILDLAVFQLTWLLMVNLASRLAAGSVSALEWGWDAMQLPETVIGTAFGLVAFPTLAELAARHDLPGLRSTLNETLRAVLVLTIPAAVGLILLGRPLLSLLYERGSFDAASTEAVYLALRFFALGLVGHASLELVARTFFAQQDTVTPLLLATASGVLNIGLGIVLMQVWGHGGLALANSIAITLEVIALLYLLRRRWGSVEARDLVRTVVRTAIATAVMAVAVYSVNSWLTAQGAGSLVNLGVSALAGAVVFVSVGLLLGENALLFLPAAIWQRKTV